MQDCFNSSINVIWQLFDSLFDVPGYEIRAEEAMMFSWPEVQSLIVIYDFGDECFFLIDFIGRAFCDIGGQEDFTVEDDWELAELICDSGADEWLSKLWYFHVIKMLHMFFWYDLII